MRKILSFSFLILINSGLLSQKLLPLGKYFDNEISFEINKRNIPVNTGFKPLTDSEINSSFCFDSIIYNKKKEKDFFKNHKETKFWKKLFFEDFIYVKKDGFILKINPLFYLQYGKTDTSSTNYFINTRGIEIKGKIGKKIAYYSSFRENQARFRPYIYNFSWERLVAPGQGAVKKNYNNLSLYDFSSASGYLSYSPFKFFNVQFGQDKNFIGEGHRSLFLSDNATNYPYLKFSFLFKNFKYVTMFSQFRDFETAYFYNHTKKHGAFNYFSYNYKNRIEAGLFEGLIYKTYDTTGYTGKFSADYFIPVLGVRTGINGFATDNNAVVGINLKTKITKFIQTYGQFALDDPKQKKYSYQIGFKIFDAFYSGIDNLKLYIQTEYNYASPRTYSHKNLKFQTWSHYNQELAVPFGSDFAEIYFLSSLSFKNLRLNYNFNTVNLNKNNTSSNIYILDDFVYTTYPDKVKISHNTLTLFYDINKATGLCLYVGFDFRKENNETEKFFMFGLKTNLNNFYYDF